MSTSPHHRDDFVLDRVARARTFAARHKKPPWLRMTGWVAGMVVLLVGASFGGAQADILARLGPAMTQAAQAVLPAHYPTFSEIDTPDVRRSFEVPDTAAIGTRVMATVTKYLRNFLSVAVGPLDRLGYVAAVSGILAQAEPAMIDIDGLPRLPVFEFDDVIDPVPATTTPETTPTVAQYVTRQVTERVETPLPADVLREEQFSFVLAQVLADFETRINNRISNAQLSLPIAGAVGPGYVGTFGLSQKIDRLDNATLTNVTVNGVTGLTDADIPDSITLSGASISGGLNDTNGSTGTSGYVLQSTGSGVEWVATSTLGISGSDFGESWQLTTNVFSESALAPTSTVNVAVSGTGTSTFAGGLEAWRAIAAPYIHATSSTATSTFAGSIAGAGSFMLHAATGYLGIGTTTPFRKLSITDAVSTAQTAIAYDSTRYTDLLTNSVGDFIVSPQGDDVFLNDDNLWVCTGGSCPTGTPSGTGNLVVESRIGIGTSTPDTLLSLQAADNSPFINLTAAGAARFTIGTDASGNVLAYTSNNVDLRLGSTSAPTQLVIKGDSNNVGIGTTTPAQQLSVQENLYVGNGAATGMGQATSTFQGDIRILGKLDVGTIDPVYTIDGVKYATYGFSTVGVKEGAALKVRLTSKDDDRELYRHTINFDQLAKGSDAWLFYQATDFGPDWEYLVVTLSPAFDGRVFYEPHPAKRSLDVYGDRAGDVSVFMIANRYDAEEWGNVRPDQEDPFTNHILKEK